MFEKDLVVWKLPVPLLYGIWYTGFEKDLVVWKPIIGGLAGYSFAGLRRT